MTYPNVVVIDTPLCGGQLVATALGALPGVFTRSDPLGFFTTNWRLGPSWYADHFESGTHEAIVIEASSRYLVEPDPWRTAARLDGFLPEVRLVAVLRDPASRAAAALAAGIREGRISAATRLLEALEDPLDPYELRRRSSYTTLLRPFVRRFGERVRVVAIEKIMDAPVSALRDLLGFLGLPLSEVRPAVDVLSAAEPYDLAAIPTERFLRDIAELDELVGADIAAAGRWSTRSRMSKST